MNKKSIFILIIALSLLTLVSCNDLLGIKEYDRLVSLDEVNLIYHYEEYAISGYETNLWIYIDGENKCFVETGFGGEPDFDKELVDVINKDGYHIYRSHDLILYYANSELKYSYFEYVPPSKFDGRDKDKENELLKVYSLMMSTNVYEYWENFAEIFVAQNDSDVISILKRWARSEFSEKERLVNEEVETLVKMRSFARSLLTEYQIEYLEEDEKVIYGYP